MSKFTKFVNIVSILGESKQILQEEIFAFSKVSS